MPARRDARARPTRSSRPRRTPAPAAWAPPSTFERVFDGNTIARARGTSPGAPSTVTQRVEVVGRRRQARSSSVRAPKTISSQLGIDARPFFEPRVEPTGPVADLPPQRARAAVPGFSSGAGFASGVELRRLGDRGRSEREGQLRLLGLRDRGLAFATATAERLEKVGGLAERLLRLVGALDRRPRDGRARDGRSRARVRERLEVRRGVVVAVVGLVEGECAAVEARLVGVGPDGAQAGDEPALQLALLREGRRLGVHRMQRLLARLESPARVVVDRVGGELELDDPAAFLVLPARPAFAVRAELRESFADDAAERRRVVGRVRPRPSTCTGTASAEVTTCSRSASTGPSKRRM